MYENADWMSCPPHSWSKVVCADTQAAVSVRLPGLASVLPVGRSRLLHGDLVAASCCGRLQLCQVGHASFGFSRVSWSRVAADAVLAQQTCTAISLQAGAIILEVLACDRLCASTRHATSDLGQCMFRWLAGFMEQQSAPLLVMAAAGELVRQLCTHWALTPARIHLINAAEMLSQGLDEKGTGLGVHVVRRATLLRKASALRNLEIRDEACDAAIAARACLLIRGRWWRHRSRWQSRPVHRVAVAVDQLRRELHFVTERTVPLCAPAFATFAAFLACSAPVHCAQYLGGNLVCGSCSSVSVVVCSLGVESRA